MYPEDILAGFQEKIRPFYSFWKSLQIRTVAAQKDTNWFNLATRASFHVCSPEEPRCFHLTDYFHILQRSVSIEKVDELLREILSSNEVRFDGERPVLLFDSLNQNSQRPSWSGPWRTAAGEESVKRIGGEETCWGFSGFGPRNSDYLDSDRLRRVGSASRLKDPIFSDLRSFLHGFLPGIGVELYSNSIIEIVAQLPFRIWFSHVNGVSGKLFVRAPVSAFGSSLKIIAHTRPEILRHSVFESSKSLAVQETGELWRQEMRFEWPAGAREAAFYLYFEEEEVAEEKVWRWPYARMLPGAVDEFIDPYYDRLHEWLFPETGGKQRAKKIDAKDFEVGVVRLLVRIGIPAVWYGGKVYHNKPDLAAVIESTETPTIILGECTLKNPVVKFANFEPYERQLRQQIGRDFHFLPVVFTQSRIVSSEREAAIERGIALVGSEELRTLWQFFGWPDKALQFLRQLSARSISDPEEGLLP